MLETFKTFLATQVVLCKVVMLPSLKKSKKKKQNKQTNKQKTNPQKTENVQDVTETAAWIVASKRM